jgi:hypothetical protein
LLIISRIDQAVGELSGTRALVFHSARHDNTSLTCMSAVDISGASSVAPTDTRGTWMSGTVSNTGSRINLHTGLTSGSNTFKIQYRVNGGTGTFAHRYIQVMPL